MLWSRPALGLARVHMNKTRLLLGLGAAMMAATGLIGFASMRAEPVEAQSGPCGTANDGVDASEMELYSAINSWRVGQGAPSMQLSGPAVRAAQWFAEAMAAGTTSDHTDTYGRSWHQRVADCGQSGQFASGETLAVATSPSGAFASMVQPPYNNAAVEVMDWNCFGVGRSGNVWVAVVVFTFTSCPEPGGGSQQTPPTNQTTAPSTTGTPLSNTATNTATPTKTPTPTATPSPTPNAEFGVTLTVCGGWNLLTIPVSGDVDDVFDTAELAVAAIYLQNGETWLRWAPGVPAYARNLSHVSTGDVLWVYRPEPSCADIEL
jgi:hypothetical protein